MYQYFISSIIIISTNMSQVQQYLYLYGLASVSTFLTIIIIIYYLFLKPKTLPVLQTVAFLLANLLLQIGFRALAYFPSLEIVSVIGSNGFMIAANFWVICIARLLYLQKLKPGKFINLFSYISRNILLTYVPSLVVTAFLVIIVLFSVLQNFLMTQNASFVDYLIYLTCFVSPHFIACTITIIIMGLYLQLSQEKCNLFIWFPLVSILFNIFYITAKLYVLFSQDYSNMLIFMYQMLILLQSAIIGLIFIVMCCKHCRTRLVEDDITLTNSIKESIYSEI